MLYKSFFVLLVAMGLGSVLYKTLFSKQENLPVGSLYDFRIKALNGEMIDFERYRNKMLLIVNTASKCGYTYQYADLQKLHEQYGDKLIVLGFPANNFLWQEPGSNQEIAEFCRANYGVTFQMFEKISVKGRDRHPLYQWLKTKSGESPSWNFCKYLIDKNGNVIGFYDKKVNPMDQAIIDKVISD